MESEPPSPVPEEEPGDLQKLIDNLELRHSEQQKEIEQLKLQVCTLYSATLLPLASCGPGL